MADEIYISRILALSVLSHVTLAKLTLPYRVCFFSGKMEQKNRVLILQCLVCIKALNKLLVIIITII